MRLSYTIRAFDKRMSSLTEQTFEDGEGLDKADIDLSVVLESVKTGYPTWENITVVISKEVEDGSAAFEEPA